eukprot:g10414.t1
MVSTNLPTACNWQEYEGDVTIYNGRGLLEMPSLLENPTEETLQKYTIASEWETWWHIPEIQNACAIEFVMDEIVKELLADLRASEAEKSGLNRTPSLISRMMPPAMGLNRRGLWDAECQRPLATWLLFYGLILSLVPGLYFCCSGMDQEVVAYARLKQRAREERSEEQLSACAQHVNSCLCIPTVVLFLSGFYFYYHTHDLICHLDGSRIGGESLASPWLWEQVVLQSEPGRFGSHGRTSTLMPPASPLNATSGFGRGTEAMANLKAHSSSTARNMPTPISDHRHLARAQLEWSSEERFDLKSALTEYRSILIANHQRQLAGGLVEPPRAEVLRKSPMAAVPKARRLGSGPRHRAFRRQ